MVNGPVFLDTNILLYSDDNRDPRKQKIATDLIVTLIRDCSLVLSLQILQEYYANATRKLKIDPALAQRRVEIFSTATVIRFTESDVVASIELHRLHQVSFWDAMILHAARLAKVSVLYSEDLAHGTTLAGVRIRNPFLA